MKMKTLARFLTHTLRAWNVTIFVITVALGASIYCSATFAQTQSGLSTIQGTVTDSSGGVMREATIHIVNNATGGATAAKSNDVGFYQAPGLMAGAYTLTVKAPNMKTYVYTLISWPPRRLRESRDVCRCGDGTGFGVRGHRPAYGYFNGAITSTLENEQISHIPINSRNIAGMAMVTTPGLEYGFGQVNGQNSFLVRG